MNGNFAPIFPFLVAALVVFGIYRRFRRSFGQQLLSPTRMKVRIGILLIIGCLLVPAGLRSLPFSGAMLVGAALGVALAIWGAARTRFVTVGDKLYFVPHTYTGIAVSLLFVGRLVYRFAQMYGNTHSAPAATFDHGDSVFAQSGMFSSPLTLGLFFVLVAYYVCYYTLVLRNSAASRSTASVMGTEAQPPSP